MSLSSNQIKWGIGIEHETMLIDSESKSVSGANILEYLDVSNPDQVSQIKKLIEAKLQYQIRWVDDFPDDDEQEIFLQDSVLNQLTKHPEIIKLLGRYGEKYLSNHQMEGVDVFHKLVEKGIDVDSTIDRTVIEFITPDFRNQTIGFVVSEMKLKHQIIKRVLQYKTNHRLEYPRVGSIFPLPKNRNLDSFTIDYTGSYHLNLSLPYHSGRLDREEKYYLQHLNKIHRLIVRLDFRTLISDKIIVKHIPIKYRKLWVVKNCLQRDREFTEILQHQLIRSVPSRSRTAKPIDRLISLKDVQEFFNTHDPLSIFATNQPSEQMLQSLLADFSDVELEKLLFNQYGESIEPLPIYYLAISKLSSLKFYRFIGKNIYEMGRYSKKKQTFSFDFSDPSGEIANFLIGFLFKDETFDYHFMLRVGGIGGKKQVFLIPKSQSLRNLLHAKKTLLGYLKSSRSKVLEGVEWPDNLIEFLKQSLEITSITERKQIYGEVNKLVNVYLKYRRYGRLGFHYLHKNWAIGVQFVLPIILASYSSCDPLSIGDSNKLTELSLRLFIAGYSFINFADVRDYGIPDERRVYNYQSRASLVSYLKDKYSYWSSDRDYLGSEFRSASRHGFDFGFELRAFDNFEISELESLLELLFLLADHLWETRVLQYGFGTNPFDNGVINVEIKKICAQGWNTEISRDYVDLLNRYLKLSISWRPKLYAYTLCNQIYRDFQDRYIVGGRGIGRFTRYVIDRGDRTIDLPNINRLSWESAFNQLVWKPNSRLKTKILQIWSDSKSRKEFRQNLQIELGVEYRFDVEDVLYALESLGIIVVD